MSTHSRVLAHLLRQGIVTSVDAARALSLDHGTVATVLREASACGEIVSPWPGLYCARALAVTLNAAIVAYRAQATVDAAEREALH